VVGMFGCCLACHCSERRNPYVFYVWIDRSLSVWFRHSLYRVFQVNDLLCKLFKF